MLDQCRYEKVSEMPRQMVCSKYNTDNFEKAKTSPLTSLNRSSNCCMELMSGMRKKA